VWIRCFIKLALDLELKEVAISWPEPCPYHRFFMEAMMRERVTVRTFLYRPSQGSAVGAVEEEFARHMSALGVAWGEADRVFQSLDGIREAVREIDRLTYEGGVTGYENYGWMLGVRDCVDKASLEAGAARLIKTAAAQPPPAGVRLAYIGVPCLIQGLHQAVERNGGRVVLNEMQREMAMLGGRDILTTYGGCTATQTIFDRIAKLAFDVRERGIRGLIVHEQEGCNKAFDAGLLARELGLPFIRLRGGEPSGVTPEREKALAAFIAKLKARQ